MIARFGRECSVASAYLLLLAILAVAQCGFFSSGQFRLTWVSAAPVLVAAVGMTLVILIRQIDISIGSQFCICGVVAALAAREGLPMPMVVLCAVAAGAMMGALIGALVAGLGLPSIVVTLAAMVILRESLRWAREGEAIGGLPAHFQWLGLSQDAGRWLLAGTALAILVLFATGLRWLAAGRTVYAVGSDHEAARLAGIRPRWVTFNVFMLMGALTGVAAMLHSVQFPTVDPGAGGGLELKVIAAVVVGGVAISGGRGTLIGSLIGVLLLTTIGPALLFLKAQPQWEKAIQGLIILAAVASDAFYRRGR
jgi:rhamnose transport system permease protein